MLNRDELQILSQLIDSLSYYKILKVGPNASVTEIQDAFHREALDLHPDQYVSSQDANLLSLSKKVYSKVVEAYRVLSNSDKRREYDQAQAAKGVPAATTPHQTSSSVPQGPSFHDENATTAARQKPSTSAAGIRFHKMAQTAFAARDYNSAKMNIGLALNSDPHNPEYLQFAHRLEQEMKRGKK